MIVHAVLLIVHLALQILNFLQQSADHVLIGEIGLFLRVLKFESILLEIFERFPRREGLFHRRLFILEHFEAVLGRLLVLCELQLEGSEVSSHFGNLLDHGIEHKF